MQGGGERREERRDQREPQVVDKEVHHGADRGQAKQRVVDRVHPAQQRMLAGRNAPVIGLLSLEYLDGPFQVAGHEGRILPGAIVEFSGKRFELRT